MSAVECPALHVRHIDKGYPFGDRVPATIRMKRSVHSDFAWMDPNGVPPAIVSQTFDAWTNSYGAVAAVFPDGRKLGVKPDEFGEKQ